MNIDFLKDLIFHSLAHGRLAFSTISPLFVDQFGRSLRFCYLEFNKEAISDGFMSYSFVFRGVWGGG